MIRQIFGALFVKIENKVFASEIFQPLPIIDSTVIQSSTDFSENIVGFENGYFRNKATIFQRC